MEGPRAKRWCRPFRTAWGDCVRRRGRGVGPVPWVWAGRAVSAAGLGDDEAVGGLVAVVDIVVERGVRGEGEGWFGVLWDAVYAQYLQLVQVQERVPAGGDLVGVEVDLGQGVGLGEEQLGMLRVSL